MKVPRKQLHATALTTFTTCAEAFRRRYVEGHKIPPGSALIVGSSTDDSVSANLENKVAERPQCPACNRAALVHTCHITEEEAIDIAAQSVTERFGAEVSLDQNERTIGKARTRDIAKDKAVRLSRFHHRHVAPMLAVTAVRKRWSVALDDFLRQRGVKGVKIDLVGEIDQVTESDLGEGEDVHDLKTSKRSPKEDAAEVSVQLSSYALGKQITDGRLPTAVVLDYLVDLKGGVEHRVRRATKTNFDIAALLNRVEVVVRSMKAGLFPPASRDSWKCTARWCGYFSTCPYVKNAHTVALKAPDPRLNKLNSQLVILPNESDDNLKAEETD